MAAITPIQPSGEFTLVRTGTAQANTGQTDWIQVPAWAQFAKVDFNLTAVAGTTPLADLTINGSDPATNDDTYIYKLRGHAAFTQITGAAHLVVDLGPGVLGIADDVTTAATGYSDAAINTVLPALLGLRLVFDRTSGDETYTYKLSVLFRSGSR